MKNTYRLRKDDVWNEMLVSLVPSETSPNYWVSAHDLRPALEQWLDVVTDSPKESVAAYPHYLQCRIAECERCHTIRTKALAFVNRYGPGDLERVPVLGGRIMRGYAMQGAFASAQSRSRQVPLELFLWAAFLLSCQWKTVEAIWRTADPDQRYPLIQQLVGMDGEERARWRALTQVAARLLWIAPGQGENKHEGYGAPEFFWQWPVMLAKMACDLGHPPFRVRDWFSAQIPKIPEYVGQGWLGQAEGDHLTETLQQSLATDGATAAGYDVRDNTLNPTLSLAGWGLQAKVVDGPQTVLAEMEVATTCLWQRVEGEFARQLVTGNGIPSACEHCARPFIEHRGQVGRPRRFCTNTCRMAWHRQKG
jgi:hypothetical protein